jgi:hypothetical protein
MLGSLAFVSPASAEAKSVEPQQNSLQDKIDDLLAYLRSESYDVTSEVARMARAHKGTIDAAESMLRARLARLGAALSGQKERAETLAGDAMARLDAWSKSAGVSWAETRRQAEQFLHNFTAWLRNQTPAEETSEIPV